MSTHLLSDTASTQAFIGGDFVDAASGATFDSLVPATGQVIVHVAAGGDVDIERAVAAARKAFESAHMRSSGMIGRGRVPR